MSGNASPAFVGVPAITQCMALANAAGTTFTNFYTAPTTNPGNGVLVGRLRATSNDTAQHVLQWAVNMGGVDYPIGETVVPAGAGTNGGSIPWKDMLADITGGVPLTLAPGETLRVRSEVAITAADTISIRMEAAPL
jgi:hypothetical protein